MTSAHPRLGILLVCAGVLASCDLRPPERPEPSRTPEGSVTIGLAATRPLDPPRATGEGALALVSAACDPLLTIDPGTGLPASGLAGRWEVAPGARRIRLHLRPGLRFHDGTPVDAAAVASSLSRVARPATASPWSYLLARVEGHADVASGERPEISGIVPGEGVVDVSLTEPDAQFPHVLAHPALSPVSPAAAARDPGAMDDRPVCSGPYRFDPAAGENDALLVASGGSRERPGLASIVVKGFEDREDAHEAYQRGEVAAAPVPEPVAARGAIDNGLLLRMPVPEITYLVFDVSRPPTGSPALRQAVSAALDRLAVVDAAFGDRREPAAGWMPGRAPAQGCEPFATPVADVERARGLLAAGGVDPAASGFPLTYDAGGITRLIVDALRVQIRDGLGVPVEARGEESPGFEASLRDRPQAGAWMLSAAADVPAAGRLLEIVFGPGGPAAGLGFSDPELDSLLASARKARDPAERDALLAKAEMRACEAMAAVPLWVNVRHWVANPGKLSAGRPLLDGWGRLALRRLALPAAEN